MWTRILAAIAAGHTFSTEIARFTGDPSWKVTNTLCAMRRAGKVVGKKVVRSGGAVRGPRTQNHWSLPGGGGASAATVMDGAYI